MATVQVSDDIKALVGRLVADGAAANEVDVIATAVRRYAEDLDDLDVLLAAAEEGMAASRRGDTVTIAGPDDEAALRERLWARAMVLAEELRADDGHRDNEGQRSGRASE
jgi:Arc/MetJ-type ribon-helix-helix transcriptional regulator